MVTDRVPSPATCFYLLDGIDWRTPQHGRRGPDRWDLDRERDRQFGQSPPIIALWSAMGADASALKTMLAHTAPD